MDNYLIKKNYKYFEKFSNTDEIDMETSINKYTETSIKQLELGNDKYLVIEFPKEVYITYLWLQLDQAYSTDGLEFFGSSSLSNLRSLTFEDKSYYYYFQDFDNYDYLTKDDKAKPKDLKSLLLNKEPIKFFVIKNPIGNKKIVSFLISSINEKQFEDLNTNNVKLNWSGCTNYNICGTKETYFSWHILKNLNDHHLLKIKNYEEKNLIYEEIIEECEAKDLVDEETIKSHEAKDLIDEETIKSHEAKDLINEETIKSYEAKIADLETKLSATEASKFDGALPDKNSLQNKIDKIKFEFILKNYFTNKFNLIDFTFNRSLVDKDMVLIFAEVDTDKGVTKILASLDRYGKIKLEGPMDLSFTAGYLIIFYIIMVLILLVLLFKK